MKNAINFLAMCFTYFIGFSIGYFVNSNEPDKKTTPTTKYNSWLEIEQDTLLNDCQPSCNVFNLNDSTIIIVLPDGSERTYINGIIQE